MPSFKSLFFKVLANKITYFQIESFLQKRSFFKVEKDQLQVTKIFSTEDN